MSLHRDLLEQARQLSRREPTRPKQASLRRAISTAYYAVFHLLVGEASKRLVTGIPFRQLASRAFIHREMKNASKSFAGGNLPQRFDGVLGGQHVPPELRRVADALVNL